MDIGVEEQWQKDFATPMPSLPSSYDTKVFDTERLAVFWGTTQDIVLLRKEPPCEWVEHLRTSGIDIPTILSLGCESKQLYSEHLDVLLPHLAKRRPQPKLLPYVATEAGWQLRERANVVFEGCLPEFTRRASNKAVQREMLAEVGIPTPDFKVFESYDELALFLSGTECGHGRAYVLKYPYGASGQGMFVLDAPDKVRYLQRRLEQQRGASVSTILILEAWHQVKSHVSYQLSMRKGDGVSLEFLRQQILSGGVFKGLRFPTDLDSTEQSRLQGFAAKLGRMLALMGAGAIINVDAIVTRDGTIYPAIDINIRFSLATYFNRYVARCEPGRYIKVHYYDLPGIASILPLLRVTETIVRGDSAKAIVASISDRCARGLRRVFMLFEAESPCGTDRLEQRWLSIVSNKEGI